MIRVIPTGPISGFVVTLLAFVVAAACAGPTAEAKSCTGGGSADEALFSQHFSRIELVGGSADSGEGGRRYGASEAVVVGVTASQETSARFCAQARSASSKVFYDQTRTLPAGETQIDLGTFEKGNYVVRVLVGETLVRNLAFFVP